MLLVTINRYTYSVGDAWFGQHWEKQGNSGPQAAAAYGIYGSSNIAGASVDWYCTSNTVVSGWNAAV